MAKKEASASLVPADAEAAEAMANATMSPEAQEALNAGLAAAGLAVPAAPAPAPVAATVPSVPGSKLEEKLTSAEPGIVRYTAPNGTAVMVRTN